MEKKKPVEYLNNDEFTKNVSSYIATGSKEDRDKVFISLDILARNILNKYHFRPCNPDDLRQEMIVYAFSKIHKFKFEKGKCFNYATTVMINWCNQLWQKHHRHISLKVKYMEHLKTSEGDKGRKVNRLRPKSD